jgi:hypothetical protein
MSKEALTVEVAIDLTQRSYAGRRECAAVRSGMGDAASICDAISFARRGLSAEADSGMRALSCLC